jgi:hypothetical protein
MAAKKNKYPNITTPRGIVKFPHIDVPDSAFTKAGEDGKYKLTLVLEADDPQVIAFLDKLEVIGQEMAESEIAKLDKSKRKGYAYRSLVREESPRRKNPDTDKWEEIDEDEPSLRTLILSSKFQPKLYDAKRQPIAGGVKIQTGDTVRVSVSPTPYLMAASKSAGVTLRLEAIQLISKGASGGGGDYANEFEDEDDGYVYEGGGSEFADDHNDSDGAGAQDL